jgi:hypothetical protein
MNPLEIMSQDSETADYFFVCAFPGGPGQAREGKHKEAGEFSISSIVLHPEVIFGREALSKLLKTAGSEDGPLTVLCAGQGFEHRGAP